MENYDLAIIGAGSVGLIAADFAVKLGARVALLERDRTGGDCTWSGCVPSKSLLKVAKVVHDVRTASTVGIHSQPPAVDMVQVREYLRSAIRQLYRGTMPEALKEKGMDIRSIGVKYSEKGIEVLTCIAAGKQFGLSLGYASHHLHRP